MLYEHVIAALTQDHGKTADHIHRHLATDAAPIARFSDSSSFGFPGWIWGLVFAIVIVVLRETIGF